MQSIQSTDPSNDINLLSNVTQINTNESYHFNSRQNRYYFHRLGMALDYNSDSQTISSLEDNTGSETEAKSGQFNMNIYVTGTIFTDGCCDYLFDSIYMQYYFLMNALYTLSYR